MKTRFTWYFVMGFFLLTHLAFAQQKTITGAVTDEDNLPLPGVSIRVQGTTKGSQTDFDGNYTISAASTDILVFSYVGFKTLERTIGEATQIDATMAVEMGSLDEVIVTGYTSKRREDVTGSVVQVDSETLQQTTNVSVDQALQGKVAGLNVSSSSGTPGATANIRIRGRSSVTAGNDPLYVIDGVPITNNNVSGAASGSSLTALSSINTNDIESITVLKDASSTAQYGARGANGVILITTKRGRDGKTNFSVSTSYGFVNDAIDGPEVLTGAERETLWYEAIYNDYGQEEGFSREGARQYYENNTDTFGSDYVAWNQDGRREANIPGLITNDDAPVRQYDISATGGDENHNFYASVGYFGQEATVIGSDFERITGSLNFTKNFTENLKFNTSNRASHSYQDGTLEGSSYFSSPRAAKFFMPPIERIYNEDGSININTSQPNPAWIAANDIDQNRFTRIISNNSLEWQTPIKNLRFTTKFGVDYQVSNYKRYRNRISGDGEATNGYGWQSHTSATNYVFQNFLNYVLDLGDHVFDFTVLQEYQENRNYYLEADGEEFGTDGLTNLNTSGSPTTANSTFNDWSVAAYMGTVSYSFDSRYVLNGTFRTEGNSRFAANNRWGDFYSVGGAWNLHREGFLDGNDDVNMIKLRASYGVTGNAQIGLNNYQVLYAYNADYGGTAASYPSSYGNEDLSWEKNHTLDIGLDFAFFKNRLNGSVAYYRRESKELLFNVPLSRTTGFDEQTQNFGRMENKGLEFELQYDLVSSDDFNISFGGNLALNENEVLELPQDASGNDITITNTWQRVEVGHPVYGWYLPTWAGVNPDSGLDEWYINGVDGETTTNFNSAERAWQGDSGLPTVTGGLNLHVDFKGFFLDAAGFYQGGNKVYESWHLYTHEGNAYSLNAYQGINTVLDRWQQPGDVTRHSKVTTDYSPWRYNSKFLFDGDFARLRNLTVGYDFKPTQLESIGINNARIFVRGTNLLTWVKDDDLVYDPEVGEVSGVASEGEQVGVINMFTPPTKSLVLGINFNF